MLDSIELRSFRPFRGGALIPFSPLTLILGGNSAGKSSVISALLIMKQTLEDPSYGVHVPALRLNGSRLEAGNYRDVVHGHSVRSRLEFTFRFTNTRPLIRPPLVALRIPRTSFAPWMHYGYSRYPYYYGSRRLQSMTLEYASAGQFSPNLSMFKTVQSNGRSAWFTRTAKKRRIQHWRAYVHDLPRQSLTLGFSDSSPFFPEINIRRRKVRDVERRVIRAMVRDTRASIQDVELFLHLMAYIGPFRTPPKRRYAFSGLAASEAGQSGEQAIDLLILERLTRPEGSRPLTTAISFWLSHMQLGDALEVSSIATGSNLFEVIIERAGTARSANLADVGFGVSQILPVLVQGLLTAPGGLYAVEQPELHLHPDAQAGLADFFLFLAGQGIRCLVETHSEYLVVRLRRRLAEGGLPARVRIEANKALGAPTRSRLGEGARREREIGREDVSIILIESLGSRSQVRKAILNDLFQLENLPTNFMTQSLVDRLAISKALRPTK